MGTPLYMRPSNPSLLFFFSIDAEECYACILNTLRNVPGLDASGSSLGTGAEAQIGGKKFVDQFLMGEIRRE
jgi:ubiquitin carboxyl-terminal hydrolase 14